jgi:ribose 1,5-bisphosphokinase PhnN
MFPFGEQPSMIYLIGAPGAGKTTLMRAITANRPHSTMKTPIPHMLYHGAIQLGTERAAFSGTDALPMNVQPAAEDFIAGYPARLILAEGDRLGNAKFFRAVKRAGYALTVLHLDVSASVLDQRRRERGSNQDASWMKGRETKVLNLAIDWCEPENVLNGHRSVEELAGRISRLPAMKAWAEVGKGQAVGRST